MSILGLDIGGANIKAANEAGQTHSRPFAMWKHPERLDDELCLIARDFPQTKRLAVTMTAELADCFVTKSEGVRFILDAVKASVKQLNSEDLKIDVWSTQGRFVSIDEAKTQPMLVAAANWHALATWCGREFDVRGSLLSSSLAVNDPQHTSLLIDIGTTTTDIIPLVGGRVAAQGMTDLGRLQTGELSYSGVKRTPVCAIANAVPFREGYCSLAAELFATTLDVYLLLRDIAEDEHDLETANGKPSTVSAAYDRIVRALCCDRDEVSFEEATQIAKFLADVQRQRLAGNLERVASRFQLPVETIIVSGSGSFLAKQLVNENRRTANARVISLENSLSPGVAEAACSFAVARLCQEFCFGSGESK